MKRGLLAIIAISLFASCADNRSAAVADIVSQWEGREILFPENSVFTIQGRDTVDFQFQNAPYKILTYVDSVGCMSCKLHLSLWNTLIAEVDSLTKGLVPIVFFIHTPNMTELELATYRENFMYPTCFDEEDKLNILNVFPSDMALQTFLLGKDNKVLAIGNPVNNPKIKSLYYKLITEGNFQLEKRAMTDISLSHTELDFGDIMQNTILEQSVMITNIGNAPLIIQEVLPSCDCIKVSYPKDFIPVGQSAELRICYTAEERGIFYKSVTINCNILNSPVDIWLTGIVK